MKDRLAIFDLDGTLVDTIRANYESYKFVAEKNGKKWNIDEGEFKKKYFGKSFRIFLPEITGANYEDCSVMHNDKEQIYGEKLRRYGKVNEHLLLMADRISDSYYLALITTASRINTEKVISIFLSKLKFDLIITGNDVKNLKPNMEAWEKAMNYFNVSSEKTMVFDDLKENIDIAVKKGMTAFQVV